MRRYSCSLQLALVNERHYCFGWIFTRVQCPLMNNILYWTAKNSLLLKKRKIWQNPWLPLPYGLASEISRPLQRFLVDNIFNGVQSHAGRTDWHFFIVIEVYLFCLAYIIQSITQLCTGLLETSQTICLTLRISYLAYWLSHYLISFVGYTHSLSYLWVLTSC